jgi:hemoglobin
MSQTLFDKYGGVPAVTLIVRDFYRRVFKRPNLRRYFEGVAIEKLILHQIAFVSMAMGRMPHTYEGLTMKEAHSGLGISGASFDLAIDLLEDAMRDNDVSAEDRRVILAAVKKLRADIVEKK